MARLDDGTRVEIQTGGTEPEDDDGIMELLAYANRKTADKPENERRFPYERRGTHPCAKDCPDRGPGCGAICEKWKSYVAKRNEEYHRRVAESEKGRATAASKRASRNALYRNPKRRNG